MKRGGRLRASSELAFEGSLNNGGRSNAVAVDLMPDVFGSRPATTVEAWIARALAAFPGAQFGSARADREQMLFKRERGLRTMPLFRDLGWLHVLCPSAYPAVYDRAALLAAPCHRIEERGDGTIWIWVYEHPLREANARLNLYLQGAARGASAASVELVTADVVTRGGAPRSVPRDFA